jgi:hypothetical protein
MYARFAVAAVALAGCHAQVRPATGTAATNGAVVGLVRDGGTGEPIIQAELRLRADAQRAGGVATRSGRAGLYNFDYVRPGRYRLIASFAGHVVEINNIEVAPDRIATVDVTFPLGGVVVAGLPRGGVAPLLVNYNPHDETIGRYRPPHANPATGLIEGTVTDTETRERVPGAVITALGGAGTTDARQTVTDDHGRFVFPDLPPGTYAVSAYYSMAKRGQIEVLRSNLDVQGGEAVVVPLWVELEQAQ